MRRKYDYIVFETPYKRTITRIEKNRMNCLICGKFMKRHIDTVTNKTSKHEWTCKCTPSLVLGKG